MEYVSSSWRGLWRPEEDEDGDVSGLRLWAENLLKAGLRPPQNRRLLFTCSVPWGCWEPGAAPRVGGTRQKTPGEATEGILLRATEPWVPARWRGSPDGAVHRELRSWDPLLWSRGEQTGRQLPSPHPEPCVLSFPLLPSSFPMCVGKKECQRHPVSQGPRPGGEGPTTKSWRSTVVLAAGDPRVVQAPTLGALCPLMGLWMCPALTAAACPSSLGRDPPTGASCWPAPQRKL